MKINTLHLFTIALICLLFSCKNNEVPKPKGYFRIALPEKKYVELDTNLPFRFKYPTYAKFQKKELKEKNTTWIDLSLPSLNGNIYLTYLPIKDKNNLNKYIDDVYKFSSKHIQKASAIEEELFTNHSANVYGMIYNIKGANTATTCQFFLTDSSNHFIRGVFYFNAPPNNDSLAPLISFVKKDIDTLINTFSWKK